MSRLLRCVVRPGTPPSAVGSMTTADGGFRKVASYGDKGNGLITDVDDFAAWLQEHVGKE